MRDATPYGFLQMKRNLLLLGQFLQRGCYVNTLYRYFNRLHPAFQIFHSTRGRYGKALAWWVSNTSNELKSPSHDLCHVSHELTALSHVLRALLHDLTLAPHGLAGGSHGLFLVSHELTALSHVFSCHRKPTSLIYLLFILIGPPFVHCQLIQMITRPSSKERFSATAENLHLILFIPMFIFFVIYQSAFFKNSCGSPP